MYVRYKYWLSSLVLSFAVAGCTGEKPGLEFVPHMMDTPAVKAQRPGPFGETMRAPVEGTVPRDFEPYHYATDAEAAGRELKNPLPRSSAILARGQKLFSTYCMVCHGPRGEGDGSIVPKFPRPPSLQSDKVKGWSDGRIFHVITMGQNLMPSYASQLDATERWAVIHYVRALQRSLNPTEADLKNKNQ